MIDGRQKDKNWNITDPKTGNAYTWEAVNCAVLMDIRDQLKALNALLHCRNFIAIPRKLDAIRKNTATPQKSKD